MVIFAYFVFLSDFNIRISNFACGMDITLTDGGIETGILYEFKRLSLKTDQPPDPKKCYNFKLATPEPRAAYCIPQGQPTLLLVVHQDSQVVCAAVHKYSHLIENLNPPSPP